MAALGYVIINVQVEGIPSYYEEQAALVIPNVTQLGLKVPVILGTPMIHLLCCQMKESEIQTALEEWQHALLSYKASRNVSIHAMTPQLDPDPGNEYPTNTGQNPVDLDEPVLLKDKVIIPVFASQIVHVQTQKMFMKGHHLNVMVQPQYLEEKAKLPVGLYIPQVYTEMKDGSQNVSMVLRNGTGKPMHLAARPLVGRIVAANLVPDAVALLELEAKLAKDREPEPPLTMEQCQELLMKVLEENGSLGKLKGWKKEMALKAKWLLMEFHHIFCLEKNEMGCTNDIEHVIELLPEQDEPFKERFRRLAPHEVEEVHQHIQEMLDGGAIQPSQSPWCNAIILVRKKDGTLRFCRLQASEHTHKERFISDTQMSGNYAVLGWSSLLLHHGPQKRLLQVKVSEDSRQYVAFIIGSMGLYKFLRMPYGLCNTPVMFQHLMQNCLGELNLSFAMVYLDDMIMYSEMPEDHLTWLQAIFDNFAHHGLKLKPSKCHFFKEEITYLGHEISTKGMLPGQKGVEEIAQMEPPMTYTGVRKFIGAVGYFCHFIKNFAWIAKLLNDLLGCGNTKLKNHPILLTVAAEEAFYTLKKKCAMAPVLAFADLKRPFLLEMDPSKYSLGAILQQVQEDGKCHPVAYASRALCGSKANYHSSKLEFLALKWAVTQQFKDYLMYQPFTMQTDNNPLTYMLMTPNLDATKHHGVSALAGFNFRLEYLCCADNRVADVLSRMETRLDDNATNEFLQSLDKSSYDAKNVSDDAGKENAQPLTKVERNAVNEIMERARFSHIPHAETDNPALVAKHEEFEKELNVQVATMVTEKHIKHNLMGLDWKSLQENNPIIQHVLKWKCHNSNKNAKKDKNADRCTLEEYLLTVVNLHDAKAYGDRQKDFNLLNDMLFINDTPKGSTDMVLLFIVPASKYQVALDLCHRNVGHQGRDRTYSLLQERFWWPKMRMQMMMTLQNCKKCKVYEKKDPKAPLCTIAAMGPMDLIHIDLVGMEVTVETKKKPVVQKILVVTNHFS